MKTTTRRLSSADFTPADAARAHRAVRAVGGLPALQDDQIVLAAFYGALFARTEK